MQAIVTWEHFLEILKPDASGVLRHKGMRLYGYLRDNADLLGITVTTLPPTAIEGRCFGFGLESLDRLINDQLLLTLIRREIGEPALLMLAAIVGHVGELEYSGAALCHACGAPMHAADLVLQCNTCGAISGFASN